MPRKKTKKQKLATSQRKQQQVELSLYQLDDSLLTPKKATSNTITASALFDYDPKFLIKDINKTVFLSIIIVSIEVSLFFYLSL